MLELHDPVLRNVISRLYDDAESKRETGSEDSTSFGLDMNQQFDSVLASFEDEVIAKDHRAKVSQLQQKALGKEEELAALEELLNQTKQRHGL